MQEEPRPPHDPADPEALADPVFAAVDLGSNSFHLVVGRLRHGSFRQLDRLREPVRLAGGLRANRTLDESARAAALECLGRFGERLIDIPRERVRAVGTNTLRRARDASAFLEAAERALGHTIEVISGEEEARLIYLGVAHSLAEREGHRLVVDIGGGSTEVILGERFQPLAAESFMLGCVGTSRRWFKGGVITGDALESAVLAARSELEPFETTFGSERWVEAIGSSGTIRAVEQVLAANDWAERGVTRKGLQRLGKALVTAGHVDRIELAGLAGDRRPVFPGGVAILLAIFKAFDVEDMNVSNGALREGLLYQLLGRVRHEDVRDLTVRSFASRFAVDWNQADRVTATARRFAAVAARPWELDGVEAERLLGWASLLHEIGMAVSHSSHHKHGAYLVAHSDMPGFSREDQSLLAALVRNHRRKPDPEVIAALPAKRRMFARALASILRIAVTLHRGRRARSLPRELEVRASAGRIELEFPAGWLDEHPLLRADLATEAERQVAFGVELAVR